MFQKHLPYRLVIAVHERSYSIFIAIARVYSFIKHLFNHVKKPKSNCFAKCLNRTVAFSNQPYDGFQGIYIIFINSFFDPVIVPHK